MIAMLVSYYYDHRCHQLLPKASENDLDAAFNGYLRDQAIDKKTASPEMLAQFREAFEEVQRAKAVTPTRRPMKLRDLKPDEYRYAVAVREGSELFVTLFIRRDPKGDVYVMIPRGRGSGNPHASYHRNGTLHHKSNDRPMMPSDRQPLIGGGFKGCEHICMFGGHAPKRVGVTCDATKFTGIVEVQDEELNDGFVAVDLVEPGCEKQVIDLGNPVHSTHVFKEAEPWLLIRVGKHRKF